MLLNPGFVDVVAAIRNFGSSPTGRNLAQVLLTNKAFFFSFLSFNVRADGNCDGNLGSL